MNDIIASSLGLPPMVQDDKPATAKLTITAPTGSQAEVANDFETARNNLITIIKNGGDAIDALACIANQSQDAEAFAALSSLMNTLVNANKQLLEIQKRIRDINREDNAGKTADKGTTNNLFVGSSADLLKLIKGDSE